MTKSTLTLLFVLALGASGCETSLSDEAVRNYYMLSEKATLERKPKELCDLLASDFSSTMTTAGEGVPTITESGDKTKACAGGEKVYAAFEQLGEKMGGMLQLDGGYTIHSITVAPDKSSATVDVSFSLDVAGAVMNIRARTTDTLILKRGKVLMQRSEGALGMCHACTEEPSIPPIAQNTPSTGKAIPLARAAKAKAKPLALAAVQTPDPAPAQASLASATETPLAPKSSAPLPAAVSAEELRSELAVPGGNPAADEAPAKPPVMRRVSFGSADLRHCLAYQTNQAIARCVERNDPVDVRHKGRV